MNNVNYQPYRRQSVRRPLFILGALLLAVSAGFVVTCVWLEEPTLTPTVRLTAQ
jgi:hypothetical protein